MKKNLPKQKTKNQSSFFFNLRYSNSGGIKKKPNWYIILGSKFLLPGDCKYFVFAARGDVTPPAPSSALRRSHHPHSQPPWNHLPSLQSAVKLYLRKKKKKRGGERQLEGGSEGEEEKKSRSIEYSISSTHNSRTKASMSWGVGGRRELFLSFSFKETHQK